MLLQRKQNACYGNTGEKSTDIISLLQHLLANAIWTTIINITNFTGAN